MIATLEQWYAANRCSHAHCPDDCEHPQPFLRAGRLYCGRCATKFGELVEMVPCGPDNCEEAVVLNPKVYFVGASGVGKTTLAKHVSERFGLPLLTGTTKRACEQLGIELAQVTTDVMTADDYQYAVWKAQLASEADYWKQEGAGFVSDRSFDLLAYTAILARNAWKIARSDDLADYMNRIRFAAADGRAVVFFIRPHPDVKPELDGRRDWFLRPDVVHRVDGVIEYLLHANEIPHVVLRDPNRRDRMVTVETVIGLAKKR